MDGLEEVGRVLAAKFAVIFPHLDERQRRLLMGAEARALGHGGIRVVARAAGVREGTVSLGVDELDAGGEPLGRVRRPGGGRKRAADLDPGLLPALLTLVEPDERGDPMSPLRWTTKSTRGLAAELARQGHQVSADTVGSLLRAEGFSLQGNAKTVEGKQHPDRDAQFRYINEQVKAHQGTADPVISVDTKKKELVGEFSNAGRQWRPKGSPAATLVHDFPDDAAGKAVPYGIYDMTANVGWVNVGTDHDTAAFAVESVRRWWKAAGQAEYPQARRLLVTADAGGSNGYRTRAWKAGLAALALETGLEVTVCHFPPGTSKWNKVEHRLFSHITMNWRGRPLASHEVVVNTIAATTTRTGLKVHAELDTSTYETGVQVSDAQMKALPLDRHDWHGDWNYTLRPCEYDRPASDPDPFDQPSPDLAWLCHPALTGIQPDEWDALITTLMTLHDQQRENSLDKRRGHRPRIKAGEGTGRRPVLTLADRLLATILHYRLALPQVAVAALFHVRPETVNKRIRDIRQLLDQAGHVIQPAPDHLADLDGLYKYATTAGITRQEDQTSVLFCGKPLPPARLPRIFTTDAVSGGLPVHIAARLLGHASVTTTEAYLAVFQDDLIRSYRAFLTGRRAVRPAEEYREPTDAEWREFQQHFTERKVELGECARPYGTPCQHEHACVRCPMLRVSPRQRQRLAEIIGNLTERIAEARANGWLGEVQGLQVSPAKAKEKLTSLDRSSSRQAGPASLGMPIITNPH